jgi:hypothetical protein
MTNQEHTATEQERLLQVLATYLAMTNEPDEKGNHPNNPEWDRGFQAAMSIIKGQHR